MIGDTGTSSPLTNHVPKARTSMFTGYEAIVAFYN
jgi:hypothetical protein